MSQPPRKRTRVDRACHSCITSKVRCQDLNHIGCLRCRQRETACSLTEETTQTPAPPDLLLSTIAELTSRVQSLERNISLNTASSSWAAPTPESTNSGLRAKAGHSQAVNLETVDCAPVLLERFTSTARQDRYPDVVGEGFITKEQMEVAFQL